MRDRALRDVAGPAPVESRPAHPGVDLDMEIQAAHRRGRFADGIVALDLLGADVQ